jgi:hypothetical protein
VYDAKMYTDKVGVAHSRFVLYQLAKKELAVRIVPA